MSSNGKPLSTLPVFFHCDCSYSFIADFCPLLNVQNDFTDKPEYNESSCLKQNVYIKLATTSALKLKLTAGPWPNRNRARINDLRIKTCSCQKCLSSLHMKAWLFLCLFSIPCFCLHTVHLKSSSIQQQKSIIDRIKGTQGNKHYFRDSK